MKTLIIICLIGGVAAAAQFPESRPQLNYPYRGVVQPDHFNGGRKKGTVALYDGKGVWDTGREHLKMFLKEKGFSYDIITAEEILSGKLSFHRPSLLIMPGGESWEYLKALGKKGAEEILNFVNQGGSYIGICAGAFYATSQRLGGYATGAYGIGLLEGTAYDGTALKTPPFIEGMMDINFVSDLMTQGLAKVFRIVMFGGPSFRYSQQEELKKGIRVMAQFPDINEPAMIRFNYGEGKVFLSGPHIEIEEDRTDWGPSFFDPDSEWPFLERMVSKMTQ